MKGLLLKDRILIKDYLVFYMIFAAVFSATQAIALGFISEDFLVRGRYPISMSAFMMLISVSSLITHTLELDEKSGFISSAFTQPITRKEYVLEKYSLAFLLTALFALIELAGIVIGLIFRKDALPAEAVSFIAETFFIGCIGAITISFNNISIFMKYGSVKKGVIPKLIACVPQMFVCWMWMIGLDHDNENADIMPVLIVTLISLAVCLLLMPMGFKWAERREA